MMYGAWSPSSCYKNRFLIPIMPVFVVRNSGADVKPATDETYCQVPFSQLLLALRAWALWERARWVIVVVAFPWMFTLASHIYTITMVKSGESFVATDSMHANDCIVAPMLRDTGPCLLITSGDLGLNLVRMTFHRMIGSAAGVDLSTVMTFIQRSCSKSPMQHMIWSSRPSSCIKRTSSGHLKDRLDCRDFPPFS